MADDLVKQVRALDGLDLAGLRAKYVEVYGVEPVSRNVTALRQQLQRKLHRMDIDTRKRERAKGGKAGTVAPVPDPAPAVTDRLTALSGMSLGQLREEFEKVFGQPSLSRNRKLLVKRIAERLQADASPEAAGKASKVPRPTLTVPLVKKGRKPKAGDRSKNATRSKQAKTSDDVAEAKRGPAVRDERLPKPGSVLERVYKGRTLRVTVTSEGFVYEDKPYRSLSAVAMAITGAQAQNGFLFFRLGKYAKPAKTNAKENAGQ
jgi:hypothetical protein